MYDRKIHPHIQKALLAAGADPGFSARLLANAAAMKS
jgi:hypothetical protein